MKLWTSILVGPVTALRRLGDWQYPVLLFDTDVRLASGSRFRCRARSDELFLVTPGTQRGVQDVLESHLASGNTFVDAGANIGFFTVLGARLTGEAGSVTAIEMIPATAKRLREHIALNGLRNVRIVQTALSDRAGRKVLAAVPVGRSGQASIAAKSGETERPSATVEVVTATLDEIAADLPSVDLLKIDVEGHEAEVLAGGRATLSKTRAVVFEAIDDEASLQAERILIDSGFVIHRIDTCNRLAERPDGAAMPAAT